MELTVILTILGYSFLSKRFLNWDLQESFFFVVSVLLCVLYFAALIDLLHVVSLILLIIGCVLGVYFLSIKVKENTLDELLQPGVLFFVLGASALWCLTRTDYFSVLLHWDDFSNWARTSKVIFLNDGLVTLKDPVWQKDYPPGAELFQYFVFQLSGYSVSTAFYAQGLLLLAACASLLDYKHSKPWLVLGLLTIFFYFLFHTFGLGFHTLTVDLLIAVFFGCGISAYWISDRSIGAIVRLIPVIMALPLIKIMGVAFAAIMIAIVLSDQLWRLKCRQGSVRSVGISFLLLPLLLLSFMSWQHHFKEMGASKTFNGDISIEKVVQAFSNDSSEYQQLIIHNFVERLVSSKAFLTLVLLSILAFMFIRNRKKNNVDKHALELLFFWLLLGLAAYLLLLLVLYMFFFGDYEAVRLASYNRYVKTYIVGFSIVVFILLFHQYLEEASFKIRRYLLSFLVIFSIAAAGFGFRGGIGSIYFSIMGRGVPQANVLIDKLAKKVTDVVPKDKKIYFIWQNSTGFEMQMFSYGVIPRLGNHGCWSVGDKYYAGDVWTCELNEKQFENAILEYDYLFLGHVDGHFIRRYKGLFENSVIKDGQLYEIKKVQGGLHLMLRKL